VTAILNGERVSIPRALLVRCKGVLVNGRTFIDTDFKCVYAADCSICGVSIRAGDVPPCEAAAYLADRLSPSSNSWKRIECAS
jgi:hypothetical protein